MERSNKKISKKEKKATAFFLIVLGLIHIVVITAIIIYFAPQISIILSKKNEIYDEWSSDHSKYGITDFFEGDEHLFSNNFTYKYYYFCSKKNSFDSSILLYKYDDNEYLDIKNYLISKDNYDSKISFKYNFYYFCLNTKFDAIYTLNGNKIEVNRILLYAFNDKNNTISFYGFYSSQGSEEFKHWREFIDIYFGDNLETMNVLQF